MAAPQLAFLISKVDLLVKIRSHDTLNRKVEELFGQLVSLAQRSRQQQELLDRILEKISALPPQQAPAAPRPKTPVPCPPPTPAVC